VCADYDSTYGTVEANISVPADATMGPKTVQLVADWADPKLSPAQQLIADLEGGKHKETLGHTEILISDPRYARACTSTHARARIVTHRHSCSHKHSHTQAHMHTRLVTHMHAHA